MIRRLETGGSRIVTVACYYAEHSRCEATVPRNRQMIPCECECHAPLVRP